MASILSANALTTYAVAKARLNTIGAQIVDGTHQEDVERLVNALSDSAESYCERSFYKTERTELYCPPRGTILNLRNFPVDDEEDLVVTIDGEEAEPELIDASGGRLYLSEGWGGESFEEEIDGSISLATKPGTARQVVSVTYTAGYVTPSQVSGLTPPTRDLPYDLEEVILIALSMHWRWRQAGYTPAEAPTFTLGAGTIPDAVVPMINPFRMLA